MNTEKLSHWFAIFTNISVVAGIVFLAMEVQQNSEQLDAQARMDRHELKSNHSSMVMFNNPEIAEIQFKASIGEELTDREAFMRRRLWQQWILDWEFVYFEYESGFLEFDRIGTDTWVNALQGNTLMLEQWQRMKVNLQPSFVEFLESNLSSSQSYSN